MAAKNIGQVYTDNPSTTLPATALLYSGLSPFDGTNDTAITVDDFVKKVVLPTNLYKQLTTSDFSLLLNAKNVAGGATPLTITMPVLPAVFSSFGAFVYIAAINAPVSEPHTVRADGSGVLFWGSTPYASFQPSTLSGGPDVFKLNFWAASPSLGYWVTEAPSPLPGNLNGTPFLGQLFKAPEDLSIYDVCDINSQGDFTRNGVVILEQGTFKNP